MVHEAALAARLDGVRGEVRDGLRHVLEAGLDPAGQLVPAPATRDGRADPFSTRQFEGWDKMILPVLSGAEGAAVSTKAVRLVCPANSG
jgi:hypothetical protein